MNPAETCQEQPLDQDAFKAPRVLKKGRWTEDEHSRFLESLMKFGKDWEKIEEYVGTRDILNIRAHAQKFLSKLVKFIEKGEKRTGKDKDMTDEDIEIYYKVLAKKIHKSHKWMAEKNKNRPPIQ